MEDRAIPARREPERRPRGQGAGKYRRFRIHLSCFRRAEQALSRFQDFLSLTIARAVFRFPSGMQAASFDDTISDHLDTVQRP